MRDLNELVAEIDALTERFRRDLDLNAEQAPALNEPAPLYPEVTDAIARLEQAIARLRVLDLLAGVDEIREAVGRLGRLKRRVQPVGRRPVDPDDAAPARRARDKAGGMTVDAIAKKEGTSPEAVSASLRPSRRKRTQ